KLADTQHKLGEQNPALKAALAGTQSEIETILTNKDTAGDMVPGLRDAYTGLASALRAVESGDRAVPSQAIAVYRESSQQVKTRIAEWTLFKQTKLPALNQKLRDGSLAPIAISEIEQEVDDLIS